jgi:hypothetical protein
LLFTVGKFLIGIYLGKSSFSSAYGATGSLVVLLLWIYYSAQIFLLGAEFTRVVHMNMVRTAHRRACNAFPLHLTLLNGSNRHRESPTASHTVFQAAKVPGTAARERQFVLRKHPVYGADPSANQHE